LVHPIQTGVLTRDAGFFVSSFYRIAGTGVPSFHSRAENGGAGPVLKDRRSGAITGLNRVHCGPLNQHQRAAIGLTRRDKKSRLLTLPGYDALNDIINQINPNSLARAISQWLAAHSDLLPKTLALDGKDLGKGKLGALVTLCHHHTGAPLAMRTYSGEKNDCELPVSQTLLKQAATLLANAVVTGDALNCQKKPR